MCIRFSQRAQAEIYSRRLHNLSSLDDAFTQFFSRVNKLWGTRERFPPASLLSSSSCSTLNFHRFSIASHRQTLLASTQFSLLLNFILWKLLHSFAPFSLVVVVLLAHSATVSGVLSKKFSHFSLLYSTELPAQLSVLLSTLLHFKYGIIMG